MRDKISRNTILAFILAIFLQPVLANTELEQAQSFIAEGKLQQALSAANSYLTKDEKNVRALFIKGLILTKMNRFDAAEKLFVQLTKEHPRLPEPYNNLAVIYAAQGKYEKAKSVLQEAISTHPSYATAHENIGDIYAKMASQAYSQALQLDDGNQTAREKLSLIGELFSVPVSVAVQQIATAEPKKIAVEKKPVQEKQIPVQEKQIVTTAPRQIVPKEKKALKEAVLKAVNAWANAWSKQQVDDYFAFYAHDFIPPNGMTRSAWETKRTQRLRKPKFISIDVISPTVVLLGTDHAQVDFSQSYQSDTYQDRVNKMLLLKNIDQQWLIVEEQTRL